MDEETKSRKSSMKRKHPDAQEELHEEEKGQHGEDTIRVFYKARRTGAS
jgi:hypothetical protein